MDNKINNGGDRLKKGRTVMGLLLIAFAIAGMIFWETKGREAILLDAVIVASETIPRGTVITRDMVSQSGVLPENRIYKGVEWAALPKIIGRAALQDIIENSQISIEYLADDDFYIHGDKSIFVIKPDWIAMRSSSLRRGDWVDIYAGEELNRIGTYRVAFVKDANETEVTDGEGQKGSDLLDRTASNSIISHIEIIADIREYKKITDHVKGEGEGLLLVQSQGAIK